MGAIHARRGPLRPAALEDRHPPPAMSRLRDDVDPAVRAGYRRGHCRWCHGPVAPPRRTFCKNECVEEWKLRTDGKYRRQKVFARDRGVCVDCGRECHALEARLLKMLYENPSALDAELAHLKLTRRIFSGPKEHLPAEVQRRLDKIAGVKRDLALEEWTPGRSLWEADHILEVADGGGGCSLTNLATRCVWCHRAKSALSRKRRAEARRVVQPDAEFFDRVTQPDDDLFEA